MNKKFKSIMLIDDDEINNFINKTIIQKNDFSDEIHVFTSANEGLEYLYSLETKGPDVIFVDINMPITDGWEFLAHYYEHGLNNSLDSKIVMLSSSVYEEDKIKALKHDVVVEYMVKPLNSETILNLINKIS